VSSSKAGAIIHRNVAVIACDTSSTLKETLVKLADLDIDAVCLGDRHLALPARQVGAVLAKMKELGQFPRLVGELLPMDIDQVDPDADALALEEE